MLNIAFFIFMLSVIILSAVLLNLGFFISMLCVIILSIVMLSVIMPSVVAPYMNPY
jgi:hypothetical protein